MWTHDDFHVWYIVFESHSHPGQESPSSNWDDDGVTVHAQFLHLTHHLQPRRPLPRQDTRVVVPVDVDQIPLLGQLESFLLSLSDVPAVDYDLCPVSPASLYL